MAYVVAIATVIALYIVGMMMALFGPSTGRLLGIPAFLATMMILAILDSKQKREILLCIAESYQSVYRFRPFLRILMIFCVLISVALFITMCASSSDAGVADGTHPVFDRQLEYRLCNHGRYTVVTRERYLIVGSSFVIGWHTFGTLFALFGLHLILFGKWPPGFARNQRTR